MRIGELAEKAGTTPRTLRYYEDRGLLKSGRTGNGYRAYDEEDLRLLQQIQLLQDFGFELEETRPFVDCLRSGQPSGDVCPASIEVYRRKLAELDECVARLGGIREEIAGQLARAELEAAAVNPPQPRCELAHPEE